MVRLARAAIFVGGKTEGYSGAKPGIRDEYERFRAYHPVGRLSAAPVRPLLRGPEFGHVVWFWSVAAGMPCLPIPQADAKLGPTS